MSEDNDKGSGLKAGAGTIDFFDDEEGEEDVDEVDESSGESEQETTDEIESSSGTPKRTSEAETSQSRKSDSRNRSTRSSPRPRASDPEELDYPYFIRRNKVSDEREERMELYVRSSVLEAEASYRNELAASLGTEEVAKTDAREYALILAHENPEMVAEMMEEDGYGRFG